MSADIFGSLQFTGHDTAWPEVKCDRLALDGYGRLLFASVLADAGIIKGIRALVNTDKRADIQASGIRIKQAGQDDYALKRPGTIGRMETGYVTEIHRLPYGQAHAFILSRHPGFLAALTDEHLWGVLTQPHHTTPILREWVPWLRRELIDRGKLKEAYCHRCECAVLEAATGDIDEAVSDGLKDGKLVIPRRLRRVAAV